eukprot:COSAG01_NODE_37_length_34085_cov_64.376626_28_plen_582_part_00
MFLSLSTPDMGSSERVRLSPPDLLISSGAVAGAHSMVRVGSRERLYNEAVEVLPLQLDGGLATVDVAGPLDLGGGVPSLPPVQEGSGRQSPPPPQPSSTAATTTPLLQESSSLGSLMRVGSREHLDAGDGSARGTPSRAIDEVSMLQMGELGTSVQLSSVREGGALPRPELQHYGHGEPVGVPPEQQQGGLRTSHRSMATLNNMLMGAEPPESSAMLGYNVSPRYRPVTTRRMSVERLPVQEALPTSLTTPQQAARRLATPGSPGSPTVGVGAAASSSRSSSLGSLGGSRSSGDEGGLPSPPMHPANMTRRTASGHDIAYVSFWEGHSGGHLIRENSFQFATPRKQERARRARTDPTLEHGPLLMFMKRANQRYYEKQVATKQRQVALAASGPPVGAMAPVAAAAGTGSACGGGGAAGSSSGEFTCAGPPVRAQLLIELPDKCLLQVLNMLQDLHAMCCCSVTCRKLKQLARLATAQNLSFNSQMRFPAVTTRSVNGMQRGRQARSMQAPSRVAWVEPAQQLEQLFRRCLQYGVDKIDLSDGCGCPGLKLAISKQLATAAKATEEVEVSGMTAQCVPAQLW